MKQQAAKGDGGGADIPDFKELSKEELGKLSMPEQLQYQRKFNDWKAAKKAAEKPKEEEKPSGPPPPKTKEELAKMSMGEQIAYQRQQMAAAAKAKEEAKKEADAKAKALPPLNKSQKEESKKLGASTMDMGTIKEVDEDRPSMAGKGAEELKQSKQQAE